MKELKTITEIVTTVLNADPRTRNCDNLLYIRFLDELSREKEFDYLHMTVLQFFAKVSEMGVPTIESVSRIRRKVQEKNPELRASSVIAGFREEREEMFREYARS